MSVTQSYKDYIDSDEWRTRRVAALERSRRCRAVGRLLDRAPRCEMCGTAGKGHKTTRSQLDPRDRRFRVDGANGLEVHHLHYRNLGNEHPDDLIVLCQGWIHTSNIGCHELVHAHQGFRAQVEEQAQMRSY